MDCIFKAYGVIPPNHFCRSCKPLNMLLGSIGYTEKESQAASKRILRAFQIIRFEDSCRDESKFRFFSKTISLLFRVTLPKPLRATLRKSNKQIKNLEDSNPSASKYIDQISKIGGVIFEAASTSTHNRNQLKEMGKIITRAMLVHDMKKDLKKDVERSKFNAFIGFSQEKINSLVKQNTGGFVKLVNPIPRVTKKPIYQTELGDECGSCCPCYC